jgi:hypothetical protein
MVHEVNFIFFSKIRKILPGNADVIHEDDYEKKSN